MLQTAVFGSTAGLQKCCAFLNAMLAFEMPRIPALVNCKGVAVLVERAQRSPPHRHRGSMAASWRNCMPPQGARYRHWPGRCETTGGRHPRRRRQHRTCNQHSPRNRPFQHPCHLLRLGKRVQHTQQNSSFGRSGSSIWSMALTHPSGPIDITSASGVRRTARQCSILLDGKTHAASRQDSTPRVHPIAYTDDTYLIGPPEDMTGAFHTIIQAGAKIHL